MRGATLGWVLCATSFCTLAIALAIGVGFGKTEQKLASSVIVAIDQESASAIVVDIDDNPSSPRAMAAEMAEVNAARATTDSKPSAGETKAESAVPQKLLIADAIRLKLNDPILRRGAHKDDLAAVGTFYAGYDGPAFWIAKSGISPRGKAVLGELAMAKDWALDPDSFIVPPSDYRPSAVEDQAAAEIAISLAVLKYSRHARGGRVNPSGLSKLIDQIPPLRDPKTVLNEIGSADRPDDYLTDLHPKHRQFSLLRQALLAARAKEQTEPNEIEKILVNIERWRWMPDDLGSPHVWLNTPEFMMYVVKGDKIVHSEKIVVGEPRYATPIFSASMKSIVFNPKWTVPPTIVREDLLPKLRKGGAGWFGGGSNTAVLKKHRLKVLYKGRQVDPKKINWKKVNMSAISFVQAPGPENYLGKVKFLYPNKHIVYMHDTIKRDLLKKNVRIEGHHCPRVDNPGTVAAVLLAEDKGWEESKVNQLLKTGNDSAVDLDDPIPVHTTYFTSVVDSDGQLQTFADIYKLDDVIARALADAKKASQASIDSSAPRLPWNSTSREGLAVSTP